MNKEPREPKDGEKEKLRLAANVKPFTRYKLIELAVCAAAVIIGLLYLYAKIIPLGILLPIYAVCFCAIVPLRYLDAKATGARGLTLFLPVVLWSVLALVVVAATAIYFIWY